jgi:Ser/Thr protein kinase RdoA (MazF antagonist)
MPEIDLPAADAALGPPTNGAIRRGQWLPLPAADPLTAYLAAHLWEGPGLAVGWEAARLSSAAYLYRETGTGWTIVAKFYAAKTPEDAGRHAQRELEMTAQARAAGLEGGPLRAQRALGLWRGVLLLEYVDGLTLEDSVAVRRHRPGELLPAVERAAALLATLHTGGARPAEPPDFMPAVKGAHKRVSQLARWGVLQDHAAICTGLRRLIDRWGASPTMRAYSPALIHGDATTTNFVFPWGGGCVAIDWERLKVADPAGDVGRLAAEVAHSVRRQGGSGDEAEALVEHLLVAYCHARGLDAAQEAALCERAVFFRATSALRIARNGWLPRLERTALVAEALALLARSE